MRKLIALTVLILTLFTATAFAGWVNGYTRKDGARMNGYYRSAPNNTVRDNYSYKGNLNPYTGETGSNYYRNSPTSEYYGTTGKSRNKGALIL